MLLTSFRRSSRSRFIRAVLLAVTVLCFVDLLLLTQTRQALHSNENYDTLGKTPSVYIASIHWNNESILRSNWTNAVLELAESLGPEHIYISIYESGSWDDSKGALRLLDAELEKIGVQRTIILEPRTHADEIAASPSSSGWIDTPRGQKELRRIPYLSRLRNLSLKPLAELALKGITFDRVLFLNDVVFTTEDVKRLLATRNGDYAAACSLDFSKPPRYYDTFALRDQDGYEAVTPTFPYFRASASRKAMILGQPVPVQSCWNGIVAFDSKPFYGVDRLQFRGIPDSLARHHVEASECCLIHIDNPLSATRGVWLNPDVRVGYKPEGYAKVHEGGGAWPSLGPSIRGVWTNRFWRWIIPTFLKSSRINRRLKTWMKENSQNYEPGVDCLINEMQVLITNGWAHV